MNRANLVWLLVCFGAVSAFAQTDFNCSKNGQFSDCQLPNGSEIHCFDPGAGPSCQITHPSGYQNAPTVGALPGTWQLISSLVALHRRHVTGKSVAAGSEALTLSLKFSMMLADEGALLEKLEPYGAPEQKAMYEKWIGWLKSQSSAFAQGAQLFSSTWDGATDAQFYHAAKGMEKLRNTGLMAVCGQREFLGKMTGQLDSVRATMPAEKYPPDVGRALDALESDETLLKPDCTSKQAIKLMKKQGATAKIDGK